MSNTSYTPQQYDELGKLRAELQDAQDQAATEVADAGKASDQSDDRVARILKRIVDITGEPPKTI